jgi:hypothetical protein
MILIPRWIPGMCGSGPYTDVAKGRYLEHHHQTGVSAAAVSRYLTRAGLVTPEPAEPPKSSYIQFAAGQPNEC